MPVPNTTQQVKASWSLVSDKLQEWIAAFFYYLPNIIMALLFLVIFLWLSRWTRKWSYKVLGGVIKAKTSRMLISQFLGGLVMLLGVILALSILGLDDVLRTVLAGAGLAGLAVGLALQFPLANTFSGVFLATEDDIKIGNWIETANYSGEIVEIDSRSTKIKEADNNIVVIPNKTLAENPYKNYALTKTIRTSIRAAIPYDVDLELVRDICIDAIDRLYPEVERESIEFYYTDFKDSAIELLVRFFIQGDDKITALGVKSDSIMALKKAFEERSISAPFPMRIVQNR